jgi:anti-sigma factor RsiW
VNGSVCSRLGELLVGRDEDRLTRAEERLLRAHLATCVSCADAALRHDPVLLFARAAAVDALTAEARERFVEGVVAAAATARAGRRLRPRRAGAILRLAASVLLAAAVAGVWLARDREPGRPEPPAPALAGTGEIPAPSGELPPAVETVGGAGAVVYQFPPTTPGEPTVVFVVDRNADI